MMAEARAEQALITAQLRALKGEGWVSETVSETVAGEVFSPYTGSPRGSPRGAEGSPSFESAGPGPEELGALRAHVAELDHEIVQRDCHIEELQQRLRQLEEALEKALLSPAEGGLWKERYQTAQKENEVRARDAGPSMLISMLVSVLKQAVLRK